MQRGAAWGWSIRAHTPQELLIGLYLRDAAGLEPAEPHVPRVEPPLPVRVRLPGREAAAAQWSRWWRSAVLGGPEVLAGVLPPAFPGLRGVPELHGVAELLVDEAVEWSVLQREREAALVRRLPTPLFEANVVQDVQVRVGRRLPPVDVHIAHLPVRDPTWWGVAGGRFLVPLALRADRDAYLAWLRERLEEIAVTGALPAP
ncbi:hypothetical protein [Kineococcus glutinatus]|uniref:Uncharacterized protein n=1 Tax=Kineococcus glutinatus TaxID=1070872 RepID=A0ABP9I1X1_9ACTN